MTERSGEILRFSLNERLQHLVLMLCTLALVASGLALRFSDTWFGRALIGLEGGMAGRGLVHRIAAAGLMALWAYHALYVVFTERGHAQLMALRPRWQDLRDLGLSLAHNLGRALAGPRFDRFDFRQKFQYWAVALGVTLMHLTGLVLWFANAAMAAMPKWVLDLALIVHSGEGLLIFVVLFFWHLYDTHLRADVFPMDRTWLTGRLSRAQLEQRHPREHERLFGSAAEGEKA